MRCHKAQEFISLSLDDAIGEYDRGQLVQHLEGCPDCSAYQHELQRGIELLRGAALVEPSDNFEWKVQLGIQKALRDGTRNELPGSRPTGLWLSAGLSAAASALLVIGLGWAGLQSGLLSIPSGGTQPTSANARPGAQIVDSLDDRSPNLDGTITGPRYATRGLDRGNVTPVSEQRVIPRDGETANPSFMLISVEEYMAMQRAGEALQDHVRRQSQEILRLQSLLNEAHIADVGDSGAAREPR